MKYLLFIFLVGVLCALPVYSQDQCKRHIDAAGFSYCPPVGWVSERSYDKRFTNFSAPEPASALLMARVYDTPETLNEYVDRVVSSQTKVDVNRADESYQLVRRWPVTTSAGSKGECFLLENIGVPDQTYLLSCTFEGKPKQKISLNLFMPKNDRETLKAGEKVMRSFQLEQPPSSTQP